ncbi:MAG: hypothetical protein QF842_02395 [Candidatus Marinimicrobia bacterium]|jgi:thymidine phosphorylase|nr:hypothetical protein [Candidatus Neomarinimicrobiota bacterium]MDP6611483.1 hypothetical protein [Candidatus Neomarinimicrobiota bacterium]|tara:strand:+ start:6756 stop:6893 length:138 start_codon:yes stop_codon:yes gene_type:complete
MGQPLAFVHAKKEDEANFAVNMIQNAYTILDASTKQPQTIINKLK